jgi:hypothetical protein
LKLPRFFADEFLVAASEPDEYVLTIDKFASQILGAILICGDILHDLFDGWLLCSRRQGGPRQQSGASQED